MNPGGLRANLLFASSGAQDPAGNLTFREAANVQPFANTLFTMTLTGAQLRSVLEQQWQPAGSQPTLPEARCLVDLRVRLRPTRPRASASARCCSTASR